MKITTGGYRYRNLFKDHLYRTHTEILRARVLSFEHAIRLQLIENVRPENTENLVAIAAIKT